MEESTKAESVARVVQAIEDEWARIIAAHDEFADKVGGARASLRSLAGNIERQKAELEEKSGPLREDMAALREALDGGSAASEALQQELDAARESAAAAQSEVESLLSKIAKLEAAAEAAGAASQEAEALRTSEAALKEELEALRPKAEEADELRSTLESQTAALESDLDAARSERDALKAKLESLEADTDGAKEELEALRAQVAELQAAAGADEDKVEKLTAEIEQLTQARETALATEEEAGEQIAQLQKQLDHERGQVAELQQHLHDEQAKGTKASLATQLAEALQEAEEARAELRKLKTAMVSADPVAPSTGLSGARSAEEELRLIRDAAEKKGGGKFTIGELLVNAGLVTDEQVAQAIDEQKRDRHQHIGAILVRNGWASEDAVAQALAYQCNVDFVRLSDFAMDSATSGLLSERLANQHSCIPLKSDDSSLTLAMVNPLDLVAIEDIERSTGRKVEVVVGTPREITDAITKYFWEPE
ncbi:MAG: hypothetical protein GC168_21325 [Candidatus Hydrogenedens sp.]|nr:hypothetical protein [Candidatus Hydrogenedens sp.]